jgi:adenylate cyclase class IV
MTETEVKLTLNSDGYRAVLAAFESQIYDDLDQWNVFFDTESSTLGRSGRNARLRSIASLRAPLKWVVTVKRSGTAKDGIWRRPEIEREITGAAARAILDRPSTFFSHIPSALQEELSDCRTERFVAIADFRTLRRVVQWEGFHLECDESVLPDHSSFFEIEIETENPEKALELMSAKLTELAVSFVPSPMGKFRRLMMLPKEQRASKVFSSD